MNTNSSQSSLLHFPKQKVSH